MAHASIDDVGLSRSAAQRFDAAFDLGDHALADDAVANQLGSAFDVERGDDVAVGVANAFDISQQDQLLGAQGLGHFSGNQVGIDVVGFAAFADTDRSDHWNEIAAIQRLNDRGVDGADLADEPDVDLFTSAVAGGYRQLARQDELAVLTRQSYGAPTVVIDQAD